MKKFIMFFVSVMVAICANAQVKVVDGLYSATSEGGFELVKGDASYVSKLKFEKIAFNHKAGLVLGYIDSGQFAAFKPDGKPLLTATKAEFDAMEVVGSVVALRTNRWHYFYLPASGGFYGPYLDVKVVENHIFVKNQQGYWGLKDVQGADVTKDIYNRLYVVDNKKANFDLLGYSSKGWRMFSKDGTKYHVSSLNAAVKLLKDKYKPTEPVGVVQMY